MEKTTSRPSARAGHHQLKQPKLSLRGLGVFENGEFFSRRSFMDFIKRLVRGLLPKFRQPRSRSLTA